MLQVFNDIKTIADKATQSEAVFASNEVNLLRYFT